MFVTVFMNVLLIFIMFSIKITKMHVKFYTLLYSTYYPYIIISK